jgi:Kef-type K+ transport system membrane component KefB
MEKENIKRIFIKALRLNYVMVVLIFALIISDLILFSKSYYDTMRYIIIIWLLLSILFMVPGFIYTLISTFTKNNRKDHLINLVIIVSSLIIIVLAFIFSETPDLNHIYN